MKNIIIALSFIISTSAIAHDTTEAREALLQAKQAIDLALVELQKTKFSSNQLIEGIAQAPSKGDKYCHANSPEIKISGAARALTKSALAKCGDEACVVITTFNEVKDYYSGEVTWLYDCEITAEAYIK